MCLPLPPFNKKKYSITEYERRIKIIKKLLYKLGGF